MKHGVRAILPLAVLVSIAAAVVLVRVSRRPPEAPPLRTSVTGASASASARAAPLRGVPSDAGVVRESAARAIHGDSRHTHRARGRGPSSAHVAWSVDVGGPIEAQVTASPDEQTLYVASLDGALTALDRSDGAKKWRVPLGDRVYSTPCVGEDGTIYVGGDDKKFRAIDPKGTILWAIETDGEADTGATTLENGTLVFASGSTVYASRKGGDVAWRFTAKGKVFSSPAISQSGLVIFGSQDDRVYAVRGATGQLAWSVDLGADVDGAPAIGDGGEIFVGTDGDEVVCLSDSGEVVWRTNVGGFVRGVLSVARNGDVLAGVYGPTPREVRLDGITGVVRGAFSVAGTGAREFGVHGGALEDDDGALYFGAQDDKAYGLDPDGRVRFSFTTGADVDAPLTMLSDGALVVASDDGKVYLLANQAVVSPSITP